MAKCRTFFDDFNTSTPLAQIGSGNHSTYTLQRLAHTMLLPRPKERMLKVTMIESSNRCQLVVEGKLIAPWAGELRIACDRARAELGGRKLVVDIKNLTAINHDGEDVLLELMDDGVRLRGCGLFTRRVLKQLARRKRKNHRGGEIVTIQKSHLDEDRNET